MITFIIKKILNSQKTPLTCRPTFKQTFYVADGFIVIQTLLQWLRISSFSHLYVEVQLGCIKIIHMRLNAHFIFITKCDTCAYIWDTRACMALYNKEVCNFATIFYLTLNLNFANNAARLCILTYTSMHPIGTSLLTQINAVEKTKMPLGLPMGVTILPFK